MRARRSVWPGPAVSRSVWSLRLSSHNRASITRRPLVREGERCATEDPRVPFSLQLIIDFRSINLKRTEQVEQTRPGLPYETERTNLMKIDRQAAFAEIRHSSGRDQARVHPEDGIRGPDRGWMSGGMYRASSAGS